MTIPYIIWVIGNPNSILRNATQLSRILHKKKSISYNGKYGAGIGGKIIINTTLWALLLPHKYIKLCYRPSNRNWKSKYMPPTTCSIDAIKTKYKKSEVFPLKWCYSKCLRIFETQNTNIILLMSLSDPK